MSENDSTVARLMRLRGCPICGAEVKEEENGRIDSQGFLDFLLERTFYCGARIRANAGGRDGLEVFVGCPQPTERKLRQMENE